jgi:TatA/E family protein of Tat protein translocase
MLEKLEVVVILVLIIMVLFGSKKIPEAAKNIGKSVRELRKGFNEDDSVVAPKTTIKSSKKTK